MLIPAVLFGRYAEVNRKVKKAVTCMTKGAALDEALSVDDQTNASQTNGLFVLNGPSPSLGGGDHWHVWLPWTVLNNVAGKGSLTPCRMNEIFEQSLTSNWGTLGLLAHANQIWLFPEQRHPPLLQAALHFWPEFAHEGSRYSSGSAAGATLWSLPNNVKYVLARRGVSVEALMSPLPNGSLADFLAALT